MQVSGRASSKAGVDYLPSDKSKSELYGALLPMLNSRQADLLDHKRLIGQLLQLERRTARGGRDSIDHGPGGHDDLANAVAGALIAAAFIPATQNVKIVSPVIISNGPRHNPFGPVGPNPFAYDGVAGEVMAAYEAIEGKGRF